MYRWTNSDCLCQLILKTLLLLKLHSKQPASEVEYLEQDDKIPFRTLFHTNRAMNVWPITKYFEKTPERQSSVWVLWREQTDEATTKTKWHDICQTTMLMRVDSTSSDGEWKLIIKLIMINVYVHITQPHCVPPSYRWTGGHNLGNKRVGHIFNRSI